MHKLYHKGAFMSKYFSVVLLALSVAGCVSQTVPKNPPLVSYSQRNWVAVNANDFVPPNAKTYVKVEQIDLSAVKTEQPAPAQQEN